VGGAKKGMTQTGKLNSGRDMENLSATIVKLLPILSVVICRDYYPIRMKGD
jgi:hypothetical protein